MVNKIFIHGLESSGDGFKGQFFKKLFPECLTPTFKPYSPKIPIKVLLIERMQQLIPILKDRMDCVIIGSSFGGLMATLYTLKNPSKVTKLILLAPYLSLQELIPKNYAPISVPVTIIHGKLDTIVPLNQSRIYAEKLFTNLIYNITDDDHSLRKTVKTLDWSNLIENS